jgi:protein-disulfide isomerase/uncharacterized membrane protein
MSEKLVNRILLALHAFGAAVAVSLLQTHFETSLGESSLAGGCTLLGVSAGGHGCEAVALSAFSSIFIFPVAGIALGYFVGQFLLLIWASRNQQTRFEPLYASLNLATAAVIVTLVMMFLSFAVVKSFCIGCSVLWGINFLVWILMPARIGIPFSKIVSANLETLRPLEMKLLSGRTRTSILFVIGAAFVVAGASAAILASKKAQFRPEGAPGIASRFNNAQQVFLPSEVLEGDRAKGASMANAKLTVVKFADFQCPACKRSAQMFRPFFTRHQDKVRYVYRHFPLDGSCNPYSPNGSHHMACAAAIGTICAGKEGKFYEYHDLVFDGQEMLSPAMLNEIAAKIGLDIEKYKACTQSQEAKDELGKDMNWAEMISLRSTPTFIVNGKKIEGGFSPEEWEEVLKLSTKTP